jgi:hypothetical protein
MADDFKQTGKPDDQRGVSREELCRAVQVSELYQALERLGAPPDLLATAGSWGDGLEDGEVLALVRVWNAHGKIVLEKIPPVHSGNS